MRRITSLAVAVLFAGTFALPTGAEATTYYYPTSYPVTSSQSSSTALQLQQLYAQLLELQRQLAALTQSCAYLGTCGGSYGSGFGLTTVSSVDVEFFEDDDYAEVSIRYYDGDRDEFLLDAETESEVIDFLVSETNNARAHLLSVTDFSDSDRRHDDDDLRSIDVEIRNGDAHVDVRFDDGDRDSFTIRNETNHRDIIDEIADELDVDEDDVEDVIDFDEDDNDDEDVNEIDVTIFEDDEEAEAIVRFEDGDRVTYFFDTDDEDDIIEDLADLLDMDEDDVEDIVDFDYED